MRDGNRRRVARVGHHERRENQGNESETKQEIDHGFRSPLDWAPWIRARPGAAELWAVVVERKI